MIEILQNEIERLAEELKKERQSHDAELIRIAQALGIYTPDQLVTVERIIAEIKHATEGVEKLEKLIPLINNFLDTGFRKA